MARGKAVFTESVKNILKRYFIDAMGAMTLGIFVSLIIGTIVEQIFKIPALSKYDHLLSIAEQIKSVTGASIGVSVAWGLKASPLVIFSSAATGMIGYTLGGPIGGFIATVIGAEIGNLLAGRTSLDIVITPIVTIATGGLVGVFAGPYINGFMSEVGALINNVTDLNPIFMGIIVAVVIGMIFTTPLSAAAVCISINLGGLAAGAACVGCCCQAVGFAVASYKENKIGGFISQSIGTPMLQFPNILKRPQIWLPTIIASAIMGPISTAVFGMTNNYIGAGMGSCGLIGQVQAYGKMTQDGMHPLTAVCIILTVHFILPAVITILFNSLFRKLGWIKKGDMKIRKI